MPSIEPSEAQLARLEQRNAQAIADVEARLEREASELGSTADEQRKTVLRLREELERAAGQAVTATAGLPGYIKPLSFATRY